MPRSEYAFPFASASAASPAALVLCFGLFAAACESAPKAADGRQRLNPTPAANAALPEPAPVPPASRRVQFSDDPGPLPTRTAVQDGRSEGIVGALASSYDDDMRALQEMQARREAARRVAASLPDDVFESPDADAFREESDASAEELHADGQIGPEEAAAGLSAPGAVKSPQSSPPRRVVRPKPSVTPTPKPAPTEAPQRQPQEPAETPAQPAPSAPATPSTVTPPPAPDPASVPVAANSALMIPPELPTDSGALSRLLAASLARESADSETPLQSWFGYAALAVANPDLDLPADFGTDLLPEERERVVRAHAAFAALGKALLDGRTELEQSQREALLSALSAGPRFTLPKVELCTRVESFGKYLPFGDKRFAAKGGTKFIVYAEVDGFASKFEQSRFVTRLSTRISIESEQSGTDVWVRSPEWTPVVDMAEVRRTEFFVGEIVALSDQLGIGRYLLRIEARDEGSGAVAVAKVPFEVTDPAALTAAQP